MMKGHVDCTGTILSLDLEGDSLWVKVKLQEDILRYLVPKGFVSVDGTSLTVCEVSCSSACHVHLTLMITTSSMGSLTLFVTFPSYPHNVHAKAALF